MDLSAEIDQLANQLTRRRLTLSTAESCTGGLVAKLITDKPGSSKWFEGALVTYNNQVKKSLLGISESILASSGAVSQPVVVAMAESAVNKVSSNISIAISGIAGPGGGTKEKPVGMVWVAWAGSNHTTQSQCFYFDGDRESIRNQAAEAAITGCIKFIVKNA